MKLKLNPQSNVKEYLPLMDSFLRSPLELYFSPMKVKIKRRYLVKDAMKLGVQCKEIPKSQIFIRSRKKAVYITTGNIGFRKNILKKYNELDSGRQTGQVSREETVISRGRYIFNLNHKK